MKRVALTGGIATGKSHVLEQFRQLGAACLDADAIARGVTVSGAEATTAIAERFGPDVLDATGSIDRAKLAAIVFADPAARRDLEAIVHPAVYRAIEAALRAFERIGERVAMVDIPLLYETGRAGDFSRVIATVCAPETQLARLLARGMSETEARGRMDAQLPAEEKARRADVVIHTGGTLDETNAQVERVWAEILE